MEVEATDSNPVSVVVDKAVKERVRVKLKKETLKAVLEECQHALELLSNSEGLDEEDDGEGSDEDDDAVTEAETSGEGPSSSNREADELCDLIKSKFECKDFLEKLGSASSPVPQHVPEEGSSWDMVTENDLWEVGSNDVAEEEYVLVSQDDIVEGIACFMAAYLLSLKQTKELTPNQLQEALSKTFAVKKKKGKLRKAWDGSKVIYNVASWGATAIGIYQNPALLKAASDVFWASFRAISKLL